MAALQAEVMELLVERPVVEKLGLKREDLYGAALASAEALQAGDHERAFNGFCHLVMLDPMNPAYHHGLAEVALELGHYPLALQSASVIVASTPRRPEGYFLSARACLGLGEPELALEDLGQVETLGREVGQPALVAAAQKLRVLIGGAGTPGGAAAQ